MKTLHIALCIILAAALQAIGKTIPEYPAHTDPAPTDLLLIALPTPGLGDSGARKLTLGTLTTYLGGSLSLAGYQPIDSDLTSIAALTTTSYGRSLLTSGDAAAMRAALGLGTLAVQSGTLSNYLLSTTAATNYQPLSSDLTSIAALTTTSYGRFMLTRADAAAMRASLELGTLATQNDALTDYLLTATAATSYQPLDSNLTSIATLTTTSYGRSLLTGGDATATREALGLGTLATESAALTDYLLTATAATSYQPLDSNLTSIAALTTTALGRGLLVAETADTLRAMAELGTLATQNGTIGDYLLSSSAATSYQPLDSDLTSIAALTTTAHGRSLLTSSNAAASRTALGLGSLATQSGTLGNYLTTAAAASSYQPIGNYLLTTAATENFQPLNGQLTAIAALATTSFGRGLLEVGDAAALQAAAGLSAIPWSMLTSTPTTLGGYGITDAMPLAPTAISLSAAGGEHSDLNGTGLLMLSADSNLYTYTQAGGIDIGSGSPASHTILTPTGGTIGGNAILVEGTGGALPLNKGGTGAVDAAGALTNLNAAQRGDVTSASGLTMGSGKLLGRGTSGTGGIGQITVGSGLSLSSAGVLTASSGGDVTSASGLTMGTGKLLGRGTAGTGAIEQVTVGSGLSLSSAGVLTASSGGAGTVTSVSVTTANGVSGSVATATTTPALTLSLGAITPTSSTTTLTSLGTTPTAVATLANSTAATVGAQQVSPARVLTGAGWKTTATAASQAVSLREYLLPVQGTAAPSPSLVIESDVAASGTWSNVMTVKPDTTVGSTTVTFGTSSTGAVSGLILSQPYNSVLLTTTSYGFNHSSGGSQAFAINTTAIANPGLTVGLADATSCLAISTAASSTARTNANSITWSREASGITQHGIDNATTATNQVLKSHDVTIGTGAALDVRGGNGSTAGGAVTISTSATTTPTVRLTVKASGVINIAGVPTSITGLVSGDLWSNSGVLMVVP